MSSAIDPIAQRAHSVSVSVRRGGGKRQKMPSVELFIEQTFLDAIGGDVGSHKLVVKWAKQYLLPAKRKEFAPSKRRAITQSDVDLWNSKGLFAGNCAPILEGINLADLNRAYRAYRNRYAAKGFADWSTPKVREVFTQLIKGFRKKLETANDAR